MFSIWTAKKVRLCEASATVIWDIVHNQFPEDYDLTLCAHTHMYFW